MRLQVVLVASAVMFPSLACKNAQRIERPLAPEPIHDQEAELRHKFECQKLRDQIEDNLERSAYKIESLYSVFYSSKLNSCLAAKYLLYPKKDAPSSESLEIVDLLDQRTVWGDFLAKSVQYSDAEMMLDKQIEALK